MNESDNVPPDRNRPTDQDPSIVLIALFLAVLPEEMTGSITFDGIAGFLAFVLIAFIAFGRSRHDG